MKKYLFLLIAFIPGISFAQATSTIQLPAGFTASIISLANDTLTNLSGYIALVIGILLAVVVVEILIGAIRKH